MKCFIFKERLRAGTCIIEDFTVIKTETEMFNFHKKKDRVRVGRLYTWLILSWEDNFSSYLRGDETFHFQTETEWEYLGYIPGPYCPDFSVFIFLELP